MKIMSEQTEAILRCAKGIARDYGQNYVGTEHLLLAIVTDGGNLAAQILMEQGADEYRTTEAVDKLMKERLQETWVLGRLPGTPNFRDVVSKATDHARGTGNWRIGPEHVLLALLSEKESVGYKALKSLDVSMETVRKAIVHHHTA